MSQRSASVHGTLSSAPNDSVYNYDDDFEKYKLYWEERRYILQSKKEEEHKLVDTLLTLSTASIGLFCSLVFFKESSLSELSEPRLALAGLLLVGICCVLCATERLLSHSAYDVKLIQLTPETLFDLQASPSKHSKLISELYMYAFFCFISGATFMGWALLVGKTG